MRCITEMPSKSISLISASKCVYIIYLSYSEWVFYIVTFVNLFNAPFIASFFMNFRIQMPLKYSCFYSCKEKQYLISCLWSYSENCTLYGYQTTACLVVGCSETSHDVICIFQDTVGAIKSHIVSSLFCYSLCCWLWIFLWIFTSCTIFCYLF